VAATVDDSYYLPVMDERDRQRRDALYEEYRNMPEYLHAEIIHGTLYVTSRPAPKHANASSVLGIELGGPFQRGRGGPGGWWIIDEPEIWFQDKEPVIPDLAGWRLERMPELPDTAHFELVPDWICEVLSPSTSKLDQDVKLPLYAEQGVRHIWIVDPIEKRLDVYTRYEDKPRWREVRQYTRGAVRAAPFDAIELPLEALWSPPAPAAVAESR
jgi:Uma2 family endonuclease